MNGMTIGELARKCGVGVETVRFYERRGLIEQPERPRSGYRRYPPEAASRLKFIRNAKALGFSLREIGELLTMATAANTNRGRMRRKAEVKITQIDAKVEDLLGLRRELSALVDTCRTGRESCRCPIVDAFENRGPTSTGTTKRERSVRT